MKNKIGVGIGAALLGMFIGGAGVSTAWSIQLKGGAKTPAPQATQSGTDDAVVRTEKVVQMLDDLYKTAIVAITKHYVNSPADLSAATASKVLFQALEDKGHMETRLLGFTDVLINGENAPRDAFEEKARDQLLAGAPSYQEVAEEGGKRYLRVATTVPVVMEKCVMCHANFRDKEGAIGALAYKMPVLE